MEAGLRAVGELYDVVVVGCGPAGSATLMKGVELGLKCLGLEKHRFPRPKPCAGVLYPRVLEDFEVPREAVEEDLVKVKLVAPSGNYAVVSFDPPGAIVDRGKFDHLLARRVKEKGVLVEEARVLAVELSTDRCRVLAEGMGIVEARFVVAADGVYSAVARSLGAPWRLDELALTLQAYMEVSESEHLDVRGVFEVYYDPLETPGGWKWVAGRRRDVLVGIGQPIRELGLSSVLKAKLEEFLRRRFKGGRVLKVEAYMLPFKGPKRDRLVKGRVLFVGDAGGFVRSDTGEGIYYAMHSGEAAAEAIREALDGGDLEKTFLDRLHDHGLLQLFDATEVHGALRSVEGAEEFVERVRRLSGGGL